MLAQSWRGRQNPRPPTSVAQTWPNQLEHLCSLCGVAPAHGTIVKGIYAALAAFVFSHVNATPAGDDAGGEETPNAKPEYFLGLLVEPESDCSRYNSQHYSYGFNTDVVLAAQMGAIYAPYEDACFDRYTDVDVEHIVARKEAHDSGLCKADAVTRHQFGNDLANMTLATKDLNRNVKRAKDAGEWLPDYNRCWFAMRVVQVKLKYGLSIDAQERQALQETLDACSATETFLRVRSCVAD